MFAKLESLCLRSLNVGKIWEKDQLPSTSHFGFQSLTCLRVWRCDKLKGLISASVARNLVHLQRLCVRECKAMIEVVMLTEESAQEAMKLANIFIFPQLETLELGDLPNLEGFCAAECVDCSPLVWLEIKGCPN